MADAAPAAGAAGSEAPAAEAGGKAGAAAAAAPPQREGLVDDDDDDESDDKDAAAAAAAPPPPLRASGPGGASGEAGAGGSGSGAGGSVSGSANASPAAQIEALKNVIDELKAALHAERMSSREMDVMVHKLLAERDIVVGASRFSLPVARASLMRTGAVQAACGARVLRGACGAAAHGCAGRQERNQRVAVGAPGRRKAPGAGADAPHARASPGQLIAVPCACFCERARVPQATTSARRSLRWSR
jgi:hypothetical protein